MFDLFRSRDKAIRIMLGALLLLVAFSMLTYLIPNYDTGNTSNDEVVATVGNETITRLDVQKVLQDNTRNRQMPQEMLATFVPQTVQNLITERALAYEAQRMGIVVSDSDVRDAIRQMAPSLFPDGNFIGKAAYASMLAQQNMTIAEFEDTLRRQLLVSRLRDIATEGLVVSPSEIEQEYKKKNDKIRFAWVVFKADMYAKESEPTIEDMKSYYQANKNQYQAPEKRNLAVLIADQAKLEAAVVPTDADLMALYNRNKDQYRTQERVDVRHILFMTDGKPASEEPKIKAKAEEVLKKARSGADFAELAKENSDDPGSKSNGGLYAGVTRGQMVPEFEQAAFSLKPGQISDLVKTKYGYHIVQAVKHEEARLRPFEEVKAELATQYKKEHVSNQLQQIIDNAQSSLRKDPAHPEKVAADLNMQFVRADNYSAGAPVPDIGTVPEFDQAVTALKKGEVTGAIALPNNRAAVALVTDVIAPRPSTFEEVQGQIHDMMVRNRSDRALRNHAQEFFDKTKANGGDIEKTAKDLKLTVKTSGDVDRSGSVDGFGSAAFLGDAFSKPDGALFGPLGITDGMAVGKILSRTGADLSKLPEQRAQIRDELRTQKARDRANLFEAGLREELTRKGTIKIHQKALESVISQYRNS